MAAILQPPTTTSAAAYPTTFPQSILSPPMFLPYPSTSSLSLSKPKSPRTPSSAQTPNPSLSNPPPLLPPNPKPSLSNPPPFKPLLPQNTHRVISLNRNWAPTNDYLKLLRLSVRHGDIGLAKAIQASFLKIEEDTQLSNSLIVAYLRLGLITHARRVFLSLSNPDVVSYTTMISGFAKLDREYEAVEIFSEMRSSGIEPNEFSFVAILTACMRILDLELGFQVHSLAIKTGYLGHTFASNALMGLYIKCGCLDFALEVFDKMPQRDIASWNTVLTGVVKELMNDRALELFRHMQRVDGFTVDQFTLSTILVACAGCLSWIGGREIHAHVLRIGFGSNLSVNNALIGFYKKCGSVTDVETLFEMMPQKDVITWTEMIMAYMDFGRVDLAVQTFDRMPEKNCVSYNALLSGYCRNGKGLKALALFCKMVEQGIELTDFTLTSVISACGLLMDVKINEQVHGFVLKFGFGSNECIESALLDMYTKCGRMADAEEMFYQVPGNQNNPVMWTSMICGYARNGQPDEAISLFCRRQSEDMVVDEVALATVLGVCGTLGFHVIGKQIHSLATKIGLITDIGVGNAAISMYYKCGSMEDALKVFNTMSIHDIVSWNNLMVGYLLHRQGDQVLDLWSKMERAGQQPDSLTFLWIIAAYRYTNANLVDNCRRLLLAMKTTYDIEPTSEHYAAFIGVLGYWDILEEAEEIINTMPFEPDASVWRALLDASRIRSDTRFGTWAAKKMLALEPQDSSTYVLVSNLYSASGRWLCSEKIRDEMRKKGFRKHPSQSWVIHQNKVHSFYSRDKSHCLSKDICSGLEILILECLKAGYVPDTSFVLHDVDMYQKKDFLFYHSAKLAVTYGILMTSPGKPIRVMKNVLLCGDCHTFFKHVSVLTGREIQLRDASGFHCFVNGECSCKDYW
ncbi:pentatricopeptide repeat-containing protein At5g03800 [Actinidia eriantha]|uniref:pentatricopeptide repeat-containing protein At5g03800 n=1 Tax=Actinidia eriantha TaxID=165200 RepID=UPI00258D4D68|nr:pentatricopeptide repeat-containing protein At5g03800 [Actinidia eriantha]